MSLSILLISLFTFVELNCENLFDCQHDSLKNDTEFLPDGAYHWTRTRYWQKLDRIGQTILSCGEQQVANQQSAKSQVAKRKVRGANNGKSWVHFRNRRHNSWERHCLLREKALDRRYIRSIACFQYSILM